jgi:hypothetical protein
MVPSEVDVSSRDYSYQPFVISAQLQPCEWTRAALEWWLQLCCQWNSMLHVGVYILHSTDSGYPDLSASGEALCHFWWLILSPACGLSVMNDVICLLGVLPSHDQNCYFVVPNVNWIIQIPDIQVVINVVFAVGEIIDKPSNVILLLPLSHYVPLSQVINSLDSWSLLFLHLLDIYFG